MITGGCNMEPWQTKHFLVYTLKVNSIDQIHSKHTHSLGRFPKPLSAAGQQLCAEGANLDCPLPGKQTWTFVALAELIYHLESIKPYNLRPLWGNYDLQCFVLWENQKSHRSVLISIIPLHSASIMQPDVLLPFMICHEYENKQFTLTKQNWYCLW